MPRLVSASSHGLAFVDEFPRSIKPLRQFQIPLTEGVHLRPARCGRKEAEVSLVPAISAGGAILLRIWMQPPQVLTGYCLEHQAGND